MPNGGCTGNRSGGVLLRWFAANPLVGLVSFLIGFVSLGATVYFGLQSLKSRDLSLYLNPTKTTIVKSGQASDLHVLYRGQPITADVTALQVAIWNAGKEPIRPEHFLTPIMIETSPKAPILEARIQRLTRPETQFTVKADQAAEGKVEISWRILEHNDGALLQFIVAGGTATVVVPRGTIEGQRNVQIFERKDSLWVKLVILLIVGSCISYIDSLMRRVIANAQRGVRSRIPIIAMLVALAIMIGALLGLYRVLSVSTPFNM
jgi:hypothetical protein